MTRKLRGTNIQVAETRHNAPDPAEMVILCYWCARKQWGFVDEFQGNAPLDDDFFGHLEEVGQVRLTEVHRDLMRQALLHYSEPGHFGPNLGNKRQAMRRIGRHAEGLLREMKSGGDAHASWAEFHITPAWVKKRGAEWWQQVASVLELMKEEANFSLYISNTQQAGRHRPKNQAVIDLVQQCGHVYASAGGRAKVSNNAGIYQGPYVEFLTAIWDVIPRRMRPPSPNTFVRAAIEYFANCEVVPRAKSRGPTSRAITVSRPKR